MPNDEIQSGLAPYKDALLKLAPIEKSLHNHQRYIDQEDAKKRKTNIIITGVKEAIVEENPATVDGELIEVSGKSELCKDTNSAQEILHAVGCGEVVLLKNRTFWHS